MNNSNEIGLAVVGCGRWGMNHVRTAHSIFGKDLVMVADADPLAGAKVKEIAPETEFTTDPDKVAADERIDAVIVATSGRHPLPGHQEAAGGRQECPGREAYNAPPG